MLQNEQEFIRVLRSRLEGILPGEELDDIVSDYAEHFSIGKANGRTDEELWGSLGSPEDVAREIRVMHLVKKAENVRSCRNIFHAVIATLGLGLFNLVFVLVPALLIAAVILCIFVVGVVFTLAGTAGAVFSVFQIIGISGFVLWHTPAAGVFLSVGMTCLGALLVIGDYYFARLCYHGLIRYLKWNFSVITGTECAA